MDAQTEAAEVYYASRYDIVFEHVWQRSEKLVLGDLADRQCRFCGNSEPDVTFDSVAHAVPEALGNRGLTSFHECDQCNGAFGRGIENDLGEWSKPMRTFARIRGKKGIPTLRKGPEGGWRVEYKHDRLEISSYEDDPIFVIDEINKMVTFTLSRGTYTPIAVYKAFVKVGLTLMPESEMAQFRPAVDWIRETDHTKSRVHGTTMIHTLQREPMPPGRLGALIFRRRPEVTDVPYAYLMLSYGNDFHQVLLPAPAKEAYTTGAPFSLIPFPAPGGPESAKYGRAAPKALDLTGTQPVRGETIQIRCGYDQIVSGPLPSPVDSKGTTPP